MNKSIIVFIGFLIVICSIAVSGINQSISITSIHIDELDDFIINEMTDKHIPGLSASIVINTTVIWNKAYGYASIEKNSSVTNETLFKIASVSKTVTASALMQLFEQEYFDLDDPINNYLSFNVIHPLYPSTDITFHMLLTHSSGINDNWAFMFNYVGDPLIPFQTFLKEYLSQGGIYYDPDNNFCSWEPGTNWRYSNVGVALVGYLVEVISGVDFTTYCETYLFNPLHMNDSGWYLRDLNGSHIAMPYSWNGYEYVPYGHIGWVDVPAGDLRTSSFQLINFLTMVINNGSYNQHSVLNNSTIRIMLTPQLPFNQNIGLIWWKRVIGSRTVWGHSGSDFGARAMMYFDPQTKIGVVVLINGESDILSITDKLFDYAETLENNNPPNKPKINGFSSGKAGIEYNYTFKTTDPDGDPVMYFIDWGDNNTEWTEYSDSGEEITLKHTWIEKDEYKIKVKAIDLYDAESDWATLTVSMPKNKSFISNYPFLSWLFEQFPNVFPLLRYVLSI